MKVLYHQQVAVLVLVSLLCSCALAQPTDATDDEANIPEYTLSEVLGFVSKLPFL